MDPMTMLMLMKAMNAGGGNAQQYAPPQQSGGMGGVSQTPQASPLASGANALAEAIRQKALSNALKKYMSGPAAQPGPQNAAPGSVLGQPGVQAPQNMAVDLNEGL